MNQETLIKRLRKEITQGKVVIIAGSGVSIAACGNQKIEGYAVASWAGLLQHGLAYCRHRKLVDKKSVKIFNAQIESGDPEHLVSAAQGISARLAKSPGVFLGWLQDTVGSLEPTYPDILKTLATLPCLLATLNYDGLFEKSTDRREPVTWDRPDKVQEVLLGEFAGTVLHLHGYFNEPDSVVLGFASYAKVASDEHASTVLKSFLISRTLLFVGCGGTVKDPNFSLLVDWAKHALKNVPPRHVLLCPEEELDAVRVDLAPAPWLQPLAYGKNYEELVPFLHNLAPRSSVALPRSGPVAAGPSFDLDSYRKAMRTHYSGLKLEELDPTTHDIRPLTLTGVFIEQKVRECAEFLPRVFELPKELQQRLRRAGELEGAELDEETLVQHRRAYIDQSALPVLDVVNDPDLRRLVILGDPGSGKSTLLIYLLLQWAEKKVVPNPRQDSLPLLIELRDYARHRHEGNVSGFLQYLNSGASLRWHFDQAPLDSWLQANPSIVLFDGLDEIFDPPLRKEVTTAIHLFADEYPLARVLVTSRIFGYQHQTWRDEGFRHFMLQELEDAQIQKFLVHWHSGAYAEGRQGESKRELLARAIEGSVAIRQLAENPLLLTMMAILHRRQDLPRDRVHLYEKCAELLLDQWKAQEKDAVLRGATLDYIEKRNLVIRVARVMQTSERGLAGNLIDQDTLESALTEGLAGMSNLRPAHAARALIQQLRERSFMLCSVGGRSYAFVHRTFLEYFSALEIAERFENHTLTIEQLKEEVFARWQEESWHEVLCLLAGMVAPKNVAETLQYLLRQPDPQQTCHAIFLAARCVDEVRERNELGAIEGGVLNRVKALTCFDLNFFYEEWDAEVMRVTPIRIRAVNLVAMIWRDEPVTRLWLKVCAQSSADPNVRQAAVRELARGWKDDLETLAILKERVYSDEDPSVRQATVQELASGWKEDRATLPWLKQNANSDEDSDVRQAAVRELARGWKDDPETLAILKERVSSDEDSDVRQVALQELGRGWKKESKISVILKQSASCDQYWAVRESAVRELARGWKDEPDTLAVLKQRVFSDEDWNVRWAAVQELARGWKEDSESFVILKQRASSDEYWPVRRTAVQELARGWKEEPETLSWLKECASSDDHWDVRQAAVEELSHGWRNELQTLKILKQLLSSDESPNVRQAAARELARGWKERPDTLTVLEQRVSLDEDPNVRWTAVQELAHGWKERSDTLAILVRCAASDEDSNVRRSAVQELARGWKAASNTLEILKRCATSDSHSDVREAAVQELARGWQENPDTLLILKKSISDKNSDVRQASVRELARGWKKAPKTLLILRKSIVSDKNSDVRLAAMRELARGWKEDPSTLKRLKKCATSDLHPAVREAAIEELVRGWKKDLETLAILKERASSDEDSAVRQTAMGELVRGWKKDLETLAILKKRASSDENPNLQQAAVRELAHGWKGDPGTFEILERITSDKDSAVRQAAVRELARGWKAHPGTLEMLNRVIFDEDSDVRQAAVQELARSWRADPRTLAIVKRSSSDKSPNVRQTAVRELASRWRTDPETLGILRRCVTFDKDSDVRQASVRELARGWKADPGTLEMLKDRAISDEDSDVRQAAVRELVRGWREGPVLSGDLRWLKQRVLSDVDQAVPRTAVQELVKISPTEVAQIEDEVRKILDSAEHPWEKADAQCLLGDVLQAQGKLALAKATFGKALEIRSRLAEQDPKNAGLQRHLAVAYGRVGDVLQAQSKASDARTEFGKLALAYSRLDRSLQAQGKPAEAKAARKKGLAIIEQLVEDDPNITDWLRALKVVHGRLGKTLKARLRKNPFARPIVGELSPIEIRPSASEDIKLTASQERIAYGANAVPEPILREWHKRNRSGFNVILYDEKKVGHLNLLPFKQDFLVKLKEGRVDEKDAKAEDIYSPKNRLSIKDLYVESLAILHPPANLKGKILIQVLSEFAGIVSRVCSPNQVRNVYALAATEEGAKLLSHLRFTRVTTEHQRKDGLSFHEILYTELIQAVAQVVSDDTTA